MMGKFKVFVIIVFVVCQRVAVNKGTLLRTQLKRFVRMKVDYLLKYSVNT